MTAPEYSTPPTAAPVTTSGEPALNKPYYGIGFGGAVVRYFKKYATFSGRASRSEYWWAYLFCVLVNSALNMLGQVLSVAMVVGVVSVVWTLGTIIPSLSVAVRRLHDRNLSGWFVLLPSVFGYVGQALSLNALSRYGASSLGDDAAFGLVVGGIVLILVGFVLALALYAGASKPEGARFDK
ncbi:DUF805 domain-containing protein [Bifidobacterium eulemuris]|uniref:DUF805 domain-containing protein n=1 Tax=Bifidobacterium eulemuris TaxID=1765219 RepID=A0A261G9S4_9BIFI|nr:DUF805 domain-containing protein [Bifidobacterium eulemuris]OZG68160.1 hypothetical protein BEUL_1173 [Bifidobacterium eulemuris]QOL31778.1 DUF805 domain-containing protein [Bifidobacterium eulemuris]